MAPVRFSVSTMCANTLFMYSSFAVVTESFGLYYTLGGL